MGEFAIGQGVSRFEDPRLVRGGGRYTDDIQLPGMAYGVVLRSPHAHAKIKSIDTAAAKAAPGVLAVITAADWKAAGFGDLPSHGGLKRRDGSPMFKPRYPVLAEDRVRWVGDPVAFVVAETPAQALDAAELVQVDYEELPAVVSTAEARQARRAARLGRVPRQYLFRRADRRQGRDRCRLSPRPRMSSSIASSSIASPRRPWSRAAPSASICRRRTATSSTPPMQRPHPYRTELAKVLKVPESKVRVIMHRHRRQLRHEDAGVQRSAARCYASKLTGRPVKWISTRTEAFLSATRRRATTSPRRNSRSTRTALSSQCG